MSTAVTQRKRIVAIERSYGHENVLGQIEAAESRSVGGLQCSDLPYSEHSPVGGAGGYVIRASRKVF